MEDHFQDDTDEEDSPPRAQRSTEEGKGVEEKLVKVGRPIWI
jgi:hypothetical protein